MLKTLNFLIVFFWVTSATFAQESKVVYSKPFHYEKIKGEFVADATIIYKGDKKGLTIKLNGKKLEYKSDKDSLRVKLPSRH